MIRSYSLMFAAPTLRLWLPLLIIAYQGEFRPAYLWVAWVCWVPNLLVAEWYIRRTRTRPLLFAGRPLDATNVGHHFPPMKPVASSPGRS
jgi:hypothetical protein